MSTGPSIAEVAALLGDVTRANMLAALMDGGALTAKELAHTAGVAPPTGSEHLAKLADMNLVTCVRQGRHRYYRLASPLVGRMVESITLVAAVQAPARRRPSSPREHALRLARTCYDHLAGRLGVAIATAMVERGHVVLGEDGGEVTEAGALFLRDGLGVEMAQIRRGKRAFCRPCLDWSERKPHLAGAVGAAIAERCFASGWIARERYGRVVAVSAPGHEALRATFGFELGGLELGA